MPTIFSPIEIKKHHIPISPAPQFCPFVHHNHIDTTERTEMNDPNLPEPGLYRHYKGGLYTLISIVRHSETEEPLVSYRSERAGTLWVRPLSMWSETVDGQPRFAPLQADSPTRYAPSQILLHWLSAALLLLIMTLAWVGLSMPKDQPGNFIDHHTLIVMHKSFGVILLVLTLIRVWERFSKSAPKPTGSGITRLLSQTVHILLYAALLVMTISGFVASSIGRNVSFFGLFPLPSLPGTPALSDIAWETHVTAQWALYCLLLLHIGGAIWHIAFRKDNILSRILPAQQDNIST